MTRRTLDIILSTGGLVFAGLLVLLGVLLGSQAAFASDYVADQLGQQKIVFPAEERLTDEEKNWKPGSACLAENAGKLLQTGKQAECYANFFIAKHMDASATTAGFPGETYATLGGIRTQLSADVAAAKTAGDTAAAEASQKKLDSATSLRGTLQTGETLRGLLLTSYGFSIFGDKAGLAGIVCYIAAAVLAMLALAGFAHAFLKKRETVTASAERPVRAAGPQREPQP